MDVAVRFALRNSQGAPQFPQSRRRSDFHNMLPSRDSLRRVEHEVLAKGHERSSGDVRPVQAVAEQCELSQDTVCQDPSNPFRKITIFQRKG